MEATFLNRTEELRMLDHGLKAGGLYVLYGRRRIGKSRLLREFAKKSQAIYFQAVKSAARDQIQDLWRTLEPGSQTQISDWNSLFELLSKKIQRHELATLILDEFPYLVEAEPILPSLLQKWCDQFLEKHNFLLICAGSSQRMMHATFMHGSEPLYGRATKVIKLPYLGYKYYLKNAGLRHNQESFKAFSLLGGVPRYWILAGKIHNCVELADELFFADSAILQDEATRLLYDEGLNGQQPALILDLIGRGCSKPSEMASRLGQSQGSLNKPLNQLIDSGFVQKEIPFGETPNRSKRILLSISDPCLKFWYSVATPYRNRWRSMNKKEKDLLIHQHASVIWEAYLRDHFKAQRFWNKQSEFDFLAHGKNPQQCLVGEVKFKQLSPKERAQVLAELKQKWRNVPELFRSYTRPSFRVFDISNWPP